MKAFLGMVLSALALTVPVLSTAATLPQPGVQKYTQAQPKDPPSHDAWPNYLNYQDGIYLEPASPVLHGPSAPLPQDGTAELMNQTGGGR